MSFDTLVCVASFAEANNYNPEGLIILIRKNKINYIKIGGKYYAKADDLKMAITKAYEINQARAKERDLYNKNLAMLKKDIRKIMAISGNYARVLEANKSSLRKAANYNDELLRILQAENPAVRDLSFNSLIAGEPAVVLGFPRP
jgi:hypothetical protein